MKNLENLINVIKKLRDPKDGCPWDLEQTHKTLLKYLIEESYEFCDAVESGDPKKIEEEIGDVLLQVLLHSQIGQDNNLFNIESVSKNLADKMIRRHPHVFKSNEQKISATQVLENWDEIKKNEKKEEKSEYFINRDDLKYPSLHSAYQIGKKSKKVNFDWDNHLEVFEKVKEEVQEIEDELKKTKIQEHLIHEELGDLLFSVAQLCRHFGQDPELILRNANVKFINRFNAMEDSIKLQKSTLKATSKNDLEKLWNEVKKKNEIKK